MSDTNRTNAATLPPEAQLIQMATASVISKVVYVAAKLGLADQLASGPKAPGELAGPLGAHAHSLYRLMRTLASLGILTEVDDQRFGLTPLGEVLRTDAPGAVRSTLITFGGPTFSAAMEQLEHSVKTGETGFEKAWGMPIFDYLGQHPEEARLFSETMVGFHGAEPPAIAAGYDFSPFKTIVDVGGATGNLLAAILARHPQPTGILYDLPHVVADAPAFLAARGVSSRVTIESGDFFRAIPDGGDAYILSHIIHDWTEAQCLTILGNCRKAMKPSARLLIVEMVLPPGDAPHPGKMLDMVMLAIPGGTERTESEYATLLASAGFRLSRVVPTASAVSVVEAVPA